ncbi:MAG: response regulator transcription factor [Chloroflexota bacterium]
MTNNIRVLIADDHTLFREGLAALLNSIPDIEVLAMVADGQSVIDVAENSKPDIILMDIQMPKVNGIEATRRIIEANPKIGIIIVTMFEDDESVFMAMRAGARGYILKGADQDEMLRVIQAVAQGEALFSAKIAARLMSFLSNPAVQTNDAFPELTSREREILELISQGLNNAEIAQSLTISLKTVRNHVSNIYNKMQVTDRVQAAIQAREAGFGKANKLL